MTEPTSHEATTAEVSRLAELDRAVDRLGRMATVRPICEGERRQLEAARDCLASYASAIRDLAEAGVATPRLMALIERGWREALVAVQPRRGGARQRRSAVGGGLNRPQNRRSDARSAPARSARSFSHTRLGATSPMPAVVSKPQSVPAMTRLRVADGSRRSLDPVGDHLGVLDVVAGGVDHPGHQRHVVGERARARSTAPRGRGGRWPSRSPGRRRSPRRAAAGSRRTARRGCAGPRSCPSTRAAARWAGSIPSSAPLMASTTSSTHVEELRQRPVGEQRVALEGEVGRVDLQQQPAVDDGPVLRAQGGGHRPDVLLHATA